MFLGKGILKICSKFTVEHPCRNAISLKLLCNFIEITLRHGCSPVNLVHIFRTSFPKNTSDGLLLTSNNTKSNQNIYCICVLKLISFLDRDNKSVFMFTYKVVIVRNPSLSNASFKFSNNRYKTCKLVLVEWNLVHQNI